MGINVEATSSVAAEPGDYLQADAVREWIRYVPDGAHIEAITREMGSQRDPYTSLVGLTAKWSDTRHEAVGG